MFAELTGILDGKENMKGYVRKKVPEPKNR